jgi:integrase/recombinase XerD
LAVRHHGALTSSRLALRGHEKLDTTARYTRVATGMIANIESPLELLGQPRKKPKKAPLNNGRLSAS